MILIGEGKTHADNLPDEIYYYNNRQAIERTLFRETCFGIRFAPVLLDTIKRSHKTLTYILRNQYSFSENVFKDILDIPKDVVLQGHENKYCFGLYDRMSKCKTLPVFYQEVYTFIIEPAFKRFGYYSPTMAMVLFIALLCSMGEFYCSSYYGLVWKHMIRDNYPRASIHMAMHSMNDLQKIMISDEMHAW